MVVVHVDEVLVNSESEFIQMTEKQLAKKYEMSKSGALDTYLSPKITRSKDDDVYISQQHYIEDSIEEHLLSDSKVSHVPCNTIFSDLFKDQESSPMSHPYPELIGMLKWVANGTWPGIQFATNQLLQVLSRPTDLHWRAALHVLSYLSNTKHLRLQLGVSCTPLIGYSDVDWVSTTEDQRSTTGRMLKFGGSKVSWKSRRQPMVALSTTEGEYMAMSDASKEALWLNKMQLTTDVTRV